MMKKWKLSAITSLIFFFLALLCREIANASSQDDTLFWYGNIVFSIVMGFIAILTVLSTRPLVGSASTQQKNIVYLLQNNPTAILGYSGFGLFIFIANMFLFYSIDKSPNPGYARAVKSLNIVFLTLIGYFLFNKQLTFEKILGILLILIGVYIVVIRD